MEFDFLNPEAVLERRKNQKIREKQRLMKQQKKKREQDKKNHELMIKEDARSEAVRREEQEIMVQEILQLKKIEAEQAKIKLQEEIVKLVKVMKEDHKMTNLSTQGARGKERLAILKNRLQKHIATKKIHDTARENIKLRDLQKQKIKNKLKKYAEGKFCNLFEEALSKQDYATVMRLVIKRENPVATYSVNHESENGFTPLLCLIYKKQYSLIRKLIMTTEVDCNKETSDGITPLIAAILSHNILGLDVLLDINNKEKNRINVNYETSTGLSALLVAVLTGSVHMLTTLIKLGGADMNKRNKNGQTPLMLAAKCNQRPIVRRLLTLGANIYIRDKLGKTASNYATSMGFLSLSSSIESSGLSSISSDNSILLDKPNQVEDMKIDDTINMSYEDRARKAAMDSNHCELTKAFVEGNVKKVIKIIKSAKENIIPNFEDIEGHTSFLVCCAYGNIFELLDMLFNSNGILINQINRNGVNGLMLACYHGHLAVVLFLVFIGLDPLALDFKGWSAIKYAADAEKHDVINYLTKYHLPNQVLRKRIKVGDPFKKEDLCEGIQKLVQEIELNFENSVSICELSKFVYPSLIEWTKEQQFIQKLVFKGCAQNMGNMCTIIQPNCELNEEYLSRSWKVRQESRRKNRNSDNILGKELLETERSKVLLCSRKGRRNALSVPRSNAKDENCPENANMSIGNNECCWQSQISNIAFSKRKSKLLLCFNCKDLRATQYCVECEVDFCDRCYMRFHVLPVRRHHTSKPIQSNVKTSIDCSSSTDNQNHMNGKSLLDSSKVCIDILKDVNSVYSSRIFEDEEFSKNPKYRQSGEDSEFVAKRRKRNKHFEQCTLANLSKGEPLACRKAEESGRTFFTNPAEIELARFLIKQKRYDEAESHLMEAYTIQVKAYGSHHHIPALTVMEISKIYESQEMYDKCIQLLNEVIRILRSVFPLNNPHVIDSTEKKLGIMMLQKSYHKGALFCKQWLLSSLNEFGEHHWLSLKIQTHLDEFTKQRELSDMFKLDPIAQFRIDWELNKERYEAEAIGRLPEQFLALLEEEGNGAQEFRSLCKTELAEDNLNFWSDVNSFSKMNDQGAEFLIEANRIYDFYVKEKRIRCLTEKNKKILRKKLKVQTKKKQKKLPKTVFIESQNVVFDNMFNGTYNRFLQSDPGKRWLKDYMLTKKHLKQIVLIQKFLRRKTQRTTKNDMKEIVKKKKKKKKTAKKDCSKKSKKTTTVSEETRKDTEKES